MKTVGNLLWLLLSGIWLAIAYTIAGLLNILFIVTIPFAVQSFKLAGYSLWPFGRSVVKRDGRDLGLRTIANLVWLVTCGWWLAIVHLIAAVFLAVTVIGIPFAKINLRMARLALLPFGKMIIDNRAIAATGTEVLVAT